nr:MAG TPA: hypothetical protein [Caudoviricetes sp.]
MRVETTRRKSKASWRTYTQIDKKKAYARCKSVPAEKGK